MPEGFEASCRRTAVLCGSRASWSWDWPGYSPRIAATGNRSSSSSTAMRSPRLAQHRELRSPIRSELPTIANRGGVPLRRFCNRAILPALAEMGSGLIRAPARETRKSTTSPTRISRSNRSSQWKAATAAGRSRSPSGWSRPPGPMRRRWILWPHVSGWGAFGTEGLSSKRVNGLFSYVVSKPEHTIPAGLALLAETSQEMTEGFSFFDRLRAVSLGCASSFELLHPLFQGAGPVSHLRAVPVIRSSRKAVLPRTHHPPGCDRADDCFTAFSM